MNRFASVIFVATVLTDGSPYVIRNVNKSLTTYFDLCDCGGLVTNILFSNLFARESFFLTVGQKYEFIFRAIQS